MLMPGLSMAAEMGLAVSQLGEGKLFYYEKETLKLAEESLIDQRLTRIQYHSLSNFISFSFSSYLEIKYLSLCLIYQIPSEGYLGLYHSYYELSLEHQKTNFLEHHLIYYVLCSKWHQFSPYWQSSSLKLVVMGSLVGHLLFQCIS